jgi:hypothetical protein
MRHDIFARPVTARPRRMLDPPATARLVAATGFPLRAAPRFLGATRRAVQVAPIAMTANQHLHAAALAQKEPGGRALGALNAIVPGMRRGSLMAWTRPNPGAIMPLHSCPARCRARR